MTEPANRRARRGGSAIYVVLAMPVLLGFVAMSVDWGRVALTQYQVQAAADEGALAAASAFTGRPKTDTEVAQARSIAVARATALAAEMQVNDIVPTVAPAGVEIGRFVNGTWAATSLSPNSVMVSASATLDMPFSAVFGVEQYTVRASAKAGPNIIRRRAPDLVIVQDVTPSMSSTDIANSRIANVALVDCVKYNASGDTRVAFATFASVYKKIVDLDRYDKIYESVRDVLEGSEVYGSSEVCLGGGGCTSHAAGISAGVDILASASVPPPGVGQAIVLITDGAPYTGGNGCGSAVMGGATTPYKSWLTGKCSALTSLPSEQACRNAGGVWSTTCRPADNGAEAATWSGPGLCSKSSSLYTTEARCEGNGGVWNQLDATTPNPAALTRWADEQKERAADNYAGAIDIYAVFYSASHPSGTYHDDNIAFLENHVIRGAGKEIGVLDAPSGASLITALEDLCLDYAHGDVGLLE